jgi:hypothetical protein
MKNNRIWHVRVLELQGTSIALHALIERIQREGIDMDGKHWDYHGAVERDIWPGVAVVHVSRELEGK